MMSTKTLFCLATALVAVKATNVHVNRGCIDINSVGVCAPDSLPINGGQAIIYAMFDGADTGDQKVNAGCSLSASWPSYYGDVYFGADNCLYDANGNLINNECCRAGTGGQYVPNPYYGK